MSEVEPRWASCVICDQREEWRYALGGWDFGVDRDAAEADEQGIVYGEHVKCKAKLMRDAEQS